MKCIVGLGNPGARYERTRHNIGFRIAEAFARSAGAVRRERIGSSDLLLPLSDAPEVVVALPRTYMNLSGRAVLELVDRFPVEPDGLIIVYDDFQLPFGTLRMRAHGSDGGHNGIASVIDTLGTGEVHRLRAGVAGPEIPAMHTHEAMAEYVLSPFTADEERSLPRLAGHAADALRCWQTDGIARAMSLYNRAFFSDADAS
ncbi:MAG: aminoacyl-tRNA hydrolase [Bacteroidetes bacterium]|nr:MAG: aminoacyl-tRNA hydrolase [Bacteroidota bacterium]